MVYFLLIVGFSFFYSTMQFNPVEVANNLKKNGGFIPGFRPGKAPRKMIESMYGAEVFYEEAVNILLPDAYEAAVKEQELKVVGYPEVELESCGKNGVVFKCTVAVYPEVTLGQYKAWRPPRLRSTSPTRTWRTV